MSFAHVVDKWVLTDGDLGRVHVWDDWAQHLSQGNELGLRNRRHLHWGQVTWKTHTHTHQQITGWNRWACCRRYKHTWDRGSLSDLRCQWKQLKVLKLTFLSQPPPKSWPRWSIYVSYMNHAWLLLEFHGYWDWPQNSITPTEMTTALPAG